MAVTDKAVEAQKEKADYEAIARAVMRAGQSADRMKAVPPPSNRPRAGL